GLGTELELGIVALVVRGQDAGELGALPEAQGQDAGGHGIEGAGVADLHAAEGAPDDGDHRRRGEAGRLVDDQDAIEPRTRAPSHGLGSGLAASSAAGAVSMIRRASGRAASMAQPAAPGWPPPPNARQTLPASIRRPRDRSEMRVPPRLAGVTRTPHSTPLSARVKFARPSLSSQLPPAASTISAVIVMKASRPSWASSMVARAALISL